MSNCLNCKFWYCHPGDIGDESAIGKCRINPPTQQGFPSSAAKNWCGQHEDNLEHTKLRDNLIAAAISGLCADPDMAPYDAIPQAIVLADKLIEARILSRTELDERYPR